MYSHLLIKKKTQFIIETRSPLCNIDEYVQTNKRYLSSLHFVILLFFYNSVDILINDTIKNIKI